MRCMWLVLLHYTPPIETNIFFVLQIRSLSLLRGVGVGPKRWFPNLCCEKRPMGDGGSKARGGKWKNMLIVSSHPIMALATRGSWPGSSGKSIYSRKAVLYYLYVWLCIEDAWYKHCCLNIWPRSLCCWWKYGFRSPWSGILASHLLEINICLTLLENLNKYFLITQVADQESTWAGLKGRFQTVGERGVGGRVEGCLRCNGNIPMVSSSSPPAMLRASVSDLLRGESICSVFIPAPYGASLA